MSTPNELADRLETLARTLPLGHKVPMLAIATELQSLSAEPSSPMEAQEPDQKLIAALNNLLRASSRVDEWLGQLHCACPNFGDTIEVAQRVLMEAIAVTAPPADTQATCQRCNGTRRVIDPRSVRLALAYGDPMESITCPYCADIPVHAASPNAPEIPDSSPDWIEKQVEKLRALKPNWDGYGGATISEAAIKAAVDTLRARPQLTPCSNGGVQIDWPDFVELSFGPDGEQEFDAPAVADTRCPECAGTKWVKGTSAYGGMMECPRCATSASVNENPAQQLDAVAVDKDSLTTEPLDTREREWRLKNNNGVMYAGIAYSTEAHCRESARNRLGVTVVCSDDGGKTWVDSPSATDKEKA